MKTLTYQTLEGDQQSLPLEAIDRLRAALQGSVVTPDDAGYEMLRQLWNGMLDRRPALITRCLGANDVAQAIDFAREHAMRLSVRGGGHHIAGNAIAEQGMTIDLSALRNVRVDPRRRTARVDPGALLGDLDREAQAFGLATPLGINSTTGVAGLCLGGGFGWLTRCHGLTADNLLSADIVTADGQRHWVSSSEEPDLFWAIRGGGGNFGVVTSFEFQLHPVGPEVYAGLVVYPFDQAERVMRAWRDFTQSAPDELSVWAVLRHAPPLPFLPESAHGQPVVVFALLYAGEIAAGERLAAPIRAFGTPLGEHLGAQPYTAFQSAFDPLLTPGVRNYWKSHNFARIDDDALAALIRAAETLPGPECEIFVAQLGGAMARVEPTATAYAGRNATYVVNVHGRWQAAEDDACCRDWARQAFTSLAPFATGGGYVNFLTEDEGDRVVAAYGINFARLQAIKQQVDPGNLFRMNLNIPPQAGEVAA
ncbi:MULTISPECIES: FAD-binding oxidoreductase [Halomonadaceae]|uniref:FAD-binding oxidoreductase n=1 Tax=Halomonadaceae TaxID=28256 RepID=UPI001583E9C6|nr:MULTISPECIES: FAD-binding oxidoreductase [Halomonas]MDI4637748.1 FAD-binding oxidoreductase [Halomonas sp. BMC7]NUJ58767.1 FAD-binding oxidoreductase [Halomonas taeanensis]